MCKCRTSGQRREWRIEKNFLTRPDETFVISRDHALQPINLVHSHLRIRIIFFSHYFFFAAVVVPFVFLFAIGERYDRISRGRENKNVYVYMGTGPAKLARARDTV